MNINLLSDKELATRIRNLETGEKVIAAENIPSGILQDVLMKRKELVKGISEDQARELVKQLPDHLLWERLAGDYYLFKDTTAETTRLFEKMKTLHKGAVVERR